ncbi:SUMF1/EgtB/PvdO family nonheme iron enzyme [Chitinispirillales bacterium ANBcel5]|uniref:SUMF1/EgtB/PvdO family nonheme iron enzyme n=1 Tax=Cellulosispirillum alkaliphilum TaxID=3039283 RepID=UPI002A5863CB|nr:SUMF1/EgtB/PvdO family nonheme iron enzyme [Chitinispirillales bacterium ANBcel5]
MTKKSFCSVIMLVTFLYSSLSAGEVSLAGSVVDKSGNPVENAEVKLQSDQSITTFTNSDGQFVLTPETTSITKNRIQPSTPYAALKGNGVDVNLTTPSDIGLSVYSMSGRKVYEYTSGQLNPGLNRVALPMNRLGSGVYVVSVLHDGNRSVFRYVTANQRGFDLTSYSKTSTVRTSELHRSAAVQSDFVDTLVVAAFGYATKRYPLSGYILEDIDITLEAIAVELDDFTETVNGESFEMLFIPGGTFTIGCESDNCPPDTDPVSGVTVSSYFIGKTEVTRGLWEAVMEQSPSGFGRPEDSHTGMTWYDAMEFACRLSQLTGRRYRMTTEAEWEYAAKNHLSRMDRIGVGEEWAYNSWNSTHSGGTDPVGPASGQHTQKTRRDAQGTVDNITGRLIRSIEGAGPALRLAVSAEMNYPPEMVPPCELSAPQMGDEPVNSYRDPRWVTGSDAHWTVGSIAIGSFDLRVWEDGTARLGTTNGQWFTSNNIAFVFVPNSGSSVHFAYIFLDETQASLISDQGFGFGSRGYIGRIVKESTDYYEKPSISDLQSGAQLAASAGDNYRMVDMINIPESAREQDPRLLDGPDHGWFQDNSSAGGVHHYRKDIDPDEFRFTVNQRSSSVMLANGEWFTVNNTFLRITHSDGYTADYLYAIDDNGTLYHNSFMAYERGDFRMFSVTENNSAAFSATCGSICEGEVPKGEGSSLYSRMDNGHSTFVPAPCPPGGCE